MKNGSRIALPAAQILLARITLLVSTILALTFGQATFAQDSREQIEGVLNFGRVTDRFFRGGQVTPDGIERLAAMGVRTIVDLRDEESPGEAETCQRTGIQYFKFPMSGQVTPDDKSVNEILSIIQRAKEPIYIHCSAGKHRAGTIAALYRIRVQGWSKERAWAEQKSYGFGPPEGHPNLYAYVYGKQSGLVEPANPDVTRLTNAAAAISDEEKLSKKTKKPDDDKVEPANSNRAGLSAAASYISLAEAIKRAKGEGGKGDVLKIDLEWDSARSVVTWDVTFSSGAEYELDANSGKLLGSKNKPPAKLATLSPLALDGSAKGLLTFQEIISKAETGQGRTVMEMELKQIKGRSEIVSPVPFEE